MRQRSEPQRDAIWQRGYALGVHGDEPDPRMLDDPDYADGYDAGQCDFEPFGTDDGRYSD